MTQIKSILLLFALLSVGMINIEANDGYRKELVYPKVWHRPPSAIFSPSICDTINYPSSYTMMIVYASHDSLNTQQLWKVKRMDSSYYSIGTHSLVTEKMTMPLHHKHTSSAPCIYMWQQTIQDTSYHDMTQLFIGGDSKKESSQIDLYEVAYFDNRIPLYQSLVFQTYLAIKNGITLDRVPYISTLGDTLWDAKKSHDFYNRIQGFGTNQDYNYVSIQSTSLEDSIVCVFTNDTLPDHSYILIGDNNEDISWSPYEANITLLQRIWKMSVIGACDNMVHIKVNSHYLKVENTDTLMLAILDESHDVIQRISPTFVSNNGYIYYTIPPSHGMFFTFSGNSEDSQFFLGSRNKTQQIDDEQIDAAPIDKIEITSNTMDGDFVASIHLIERKSIEMIIQDMAGKIVYHQALRNIKDYQYQGKISSSGIYIISFVDDNRDVLATKEVIVY